MALIENSTLKDGLTAVKQNNKLSKIEHVSLCVRRNHVDEE